MKKQFYTVVGCIIATTALVSCSAAQPPQENGRELGRNLVRDGGFEEGGTAWLLKTGKIVSAQAHSGRRSLEYINKNPKHYQFIQQDIPAQPGQILHFSALVKGEGITSNALWKAKGAGIFMQSYDANGKYLNGSFPFNLPGTFDWMPIKGIYVVPENAHRVIMGLFLRSETTGKVWFDDVTVQVEQPRLFQVFLQYPNYRGITTLQSKQAWQALVKNPNEASWEGATLRHRIKNAAGKVIFEDQQKLPAASELTLRWLPPQSLANGDYSWQVEIISPNGGKRGQQNFAIRVQSAMPRVHIDVQGFTRINGERYFPFGIYTGKSGERGSYTTTPKHLQRMADAGLNTIVSYMYGDRSDAQQFVDEAHRHNFMVIYNLKELYVGGASFPSLDHSASARALNLVEKLKNHPALLAWYINDEFGHGEIPAIEQRHREIIAVDDHPVYQVQNKLDVLPWNYASSDVIGTDPYPARFPDTPLGVVTDTVNKTIKVANGAKGVWQVAQIHDHSLHKGPGQPPTLDQMRNMAYQNLIGGAKGLLFYAYHWLFLTHGEKGQRVFNEAEYEKRWPQVRKMISEVNAILPIILKDRKVALTTAAPSTVPYQAWQDGNSLYVMVANPDPKAVALDLQIPTGWRLARKQVPGVEAQLQANRLKLQLSPIASGTLVLER